MRFADAAHVDHRPFLARRPELGRWFARVGYLGLVLAWWSVELGPAAAWGLIGALALVWFVAWYLAVGGLWRAPVVAAILLASLQLARLQGEALG